jgi:nucleotide-binding universal stress UspA family protein
MVTFMLTADRGENSEQSHRRLIIVGVDGSAEAEAAAKWAVREAELREDDVLLVHAYEVPLLPSSTPAQHAGVNDTPHSRAHVASVEPRN